MKRIYLLEVTQHQMKRYVGSIAAKDLVRLATRAELQAQPEAQRPIDPKRLENIASFVLSDGTLSTSIVIGTRDDRLSVKSAGEETIPTLFYMEFPETDDEFEKFKDAFDIMDGQHRLFSFLPEHAKLADDEAFDITFEMYIKPTIREKRIIFKNTNEKQEKVASNLLMWFREKLDMLTGKEQVYHPLILLLNSEVCSPLKGRIILGAEKITGGLKAQQIITVLDKADIKNLGSTPLANEKMLTLISEYLCGWEDAVGTKIADRDKTYGPFSKIAGLKFMILMLPTFYEQAVADREPFKKEYISQKIRELFASEGMEARDLFNKQSEYMKKLSSNPFSADTPITTLAKAWSGKLKTLLSGSFDPLS